MVSPVCKRDARGSGSRVTVLVQVDITAGCADEDLKLTWFGVSMHS